MSDPYTCTECNSTSQEVPRNTEGDAAYYGYCANCDTYTAWLGGPPEQFKCGHYGCQMQYDGMESSGGACLSCDYPYICVPAQQVIPDPEEIDGGTEVGEEEQPGDVDEEEAGNDTAEEGEVEEEQEEAGDEAQEE